MPDHGYGWVIGGRIFQKIEGVLDHIRAMRFERLLIDLLVNEQ
jgi:hypothetical protein